MTSESGDIASGVDTLDDLLNQHFAGKVVRKDLTKLVKEGANVPVFVLEYLLGSYCASQDPELVADGLETVKRILAENFVRPDEAEKIKSLIREKGTYKVIDKVSVQLNEKRDVYEAQLVSLGVIAGVIVPTAMVKDFEKLLVGGMWALVTLRVLLRGRSGAPRRSRFASIKPIQMPNMDMDDLRKRPRAQFTSEEWLDAVVALVRDGAHDARATAPSGICSRA